jgi:hypothetical protein
MDYIGRLLLAIMMWLMRKIRTTCKVVRRWVRRRFFGKIETIKPSGTVSIISATSPGIEPVTTRRVVVTGESVQPRESA